MTEKQKRFADEYIKSLNATEAYKIAYSSKNENTARKNGSRLLTNDDIQKYIQDQLEELQSDTIASSTEILENLTAILRSDIEQTKDRIKAAELIGKRYALWVDKQEQVIDSTLEINITGIDNED